MKNNIKFSEEIIQRIKDENDIIDVISDNVSLKNSGSNYTGLCPFHNEKTPSFSVSREKQIFKCFGCGEAGNVFSFVMKYHNYSFVEAVNFLADRANIDILPNNNTKSFERTNDKLYKINVDAARFYFNNLYKNKEALEYFQNRGISSNTMRKFGLGYAPDGWKNTLNYMKSKGHSELDLLNIGLIVKGKNDSIYDRFRERIIFPIFDYSGKVIGFGGRVLNDSKPKYLNSPETKLFKKGTNLYGLNFVLKDKGNEKTIIIVEGYMDCIALHQFGFNNVVASLGTALTEKQAKLLRKHFEKVVISYDADLAGKNATQRGLEVLAKEGFDLRILEVPEGKDPDEFIRNNGKLAFKQLIDNSLPMIEYRIKKAGEGIDYKDNRKVIQYISKISEIIQNLNPVEKNIYTKKIAEETGIKEQSIYDLIKQDNKDYKVDSQNMHNQQGFGQKLYLEPAHLKAARNLIKLSIENNDIYSYIKNKIEIEDFTLEEHKQLFQIILESEHNHKNLNNYIDLRCTNIELAKEWANIQQMEFEENINISLDDVEVIQGFIKEVKKYKLEESKRTIMREIKILEKKGAYKEVLGLVKDLNEMQNKLTDFNRLKGGN
ncbi:DNA primase [Clostridium grantii]|uniref:DNA primase n=1 Tax=Clostridium grantii DSM 8605 TaxID=1121316 RepID=A0A1M5QCU0_9CLOT|nr:DNA primase [Clostridium grantii]SHH11877.1 DNA primase [Clostridium grantii DSM 8605]